MDIIILFILLILLAAVVFLITRKKDGNSELESNIEEERHKNSDLEQKLAAKEVEINTLQRDIDIANTKLDEFGQIKTEKIQIAERLQNIDRERNQLKTKLTSLEAKEESRNNELKKSLEKSVSLQESLEKEKERLNDERVKEKEIHYEKMKKKWAEHEKDIEFHIKMICKNHVLKYISQEQFPYPRNKPDNTVLISDQYIIFDAKSPSNDDLDNFPSYIKNQTDNLKKYAKHKDVKKDLFLVIPSNTLKVIKQLTYNMGDYNVYIISKEAIEPIIISLKKIQDFEIVEKLSPEERDDICRIIGKFAHTTKRRIQIDQYFADEFLDTLKKAGSQLPTEILKSVIEFEGAEKLNPPMEKRNKQILTKDLIEKSTQIQKEIQIRDIPEIQANIEFVEEENSD